MVKQMATANAAQLLAPMPEYSNLGCVFSPDSSYLYCWMFERAHPKNTFYQRLPILPGPTQRIAQRAASTPGFSPDGKRMAFSRLAEDSEERDLVVTDSDGQNQQLLVPHNDRNFLF